MLPNKIGEADSTTNVENYGIRIFSSYQRNNCETFIEDNDEEYLDYNNITVLITCYSKWLSTTAITNVFGEDIQSNSIININADTLKNYLRNIILVL